MILKVLLASLMIAAPTAMPRGVVPVGDAPPVAADSAREESRGAEVDKIFAQFDKPGSPGCAVGVYRDGRMLYARGYGAANLDDNVPVTPSTAFEIASASKQFTAMSVLLLERGGKLALNDDVRKYVPQLPDYGKPITLRHLLNHTSGLRDANNLLEMAGARLFYDTTTQADLLALVTRQRGLNFAPGSDYQYSNTGYLLLAEVVRKASGKSLREFADAEIFKPLGMNATFYKDDFTMIVPRRAVSYAPRGGGGYAVQSSNKESVGAGGVVTTVEDLLKWDQNFYDARVGGKEVIEKMLTQGRLGDGAKIEYAAGLYVGSYKGLPTVRHGGSWQGFRAELLRFPAQHFSVAALCNVARPSAAQLAEQVAEVYLAGQFTRQADAQPSPATAKPITLTPEQLSGVLGDYWDPKTGVPRRLVMRNDVLTYVIDTFSRARLTAFEPARFRFGNNEIAVTREPGGLRRLTLILSDGRKESYEELRRATPTEAQMSEYVGVYYSEELGAQYTLERNERGLALRRRNLDEVTLLPTAADAFSDGDARLRFTRDARRRVTGFIFGEGKVTGLRFCKKEFGAQACSGG